VHLLSWPKTRRLTNAAGRSVTFVIEPGRLVLWWDEDHVTVYTDPDELRAFAMQVYAAAIDRDLEVQAAAVKASADRRQRRALAGHPTGVRHRPFTDTPEPPMNVEVPA
jgi:hypothetical protein